MNLYSLKKLKRGSKVRLVTCSQIKKCDKVYSKKCVGSILTVDRVFWHISGNPRWVDIYTTENNCMCFSDEIEMP